MVVVIDTARREKPSENRLGSASQKSAAGDRANDPGSVANLVGG